VASIDERVPAFNLLFCTYRFVFELAEINTVVIIAVVKVSVETRES